MKLTLQYITKFTFKSYSVGDQDDTFYVQNHLMIQSTLL